MDRFDIAIIGTGPAGVSAAITAAVRNKRILLFGSENISGKMIKARRILNYPGLPDVSGSELAGNMKRQLDGLGISITCARVGTVYAMGDYFALAAGTDMYEARSCILACGITGAKALPGENKYMGRGVSCCATCDGQFYRGKKIAVLGYNRESIDDCLYLSGLAKEVLFFPVGKICGLTDSLSVCDNINIINEIPEQISGGIKADSVLTGSGIYKVDGIFIIRDAAAPDKLVPGLAMDDTGHVNVSRQMETNIPGLFACGDITGLPYQYIKAAGEGNVAALSAVRFLKDS